MSVVRRRRRIWRNRVYVPADPVPANAYVAEDGVTPYVAEDGVTYYVQEA